jgi:hypothetical protein
VVFDGKGSLSAWNLESWGNTARAKLLNGDPVRVRIQPPIVYGEDNLDFWNKIMEIIYRAGNVTLYIDEIYAVVPPNKTSNILFALYTRGRELGIGVWGSTQRPVWIPLVAMSEAEAFIMFRLQLDEDKKRLAAFMGNDIMNPIQDEHGFFYYNNQLENSQYYSRLETSREGRNIDVKTVKTELPKKSLSRRLLSFARR